MAKTPTKGKPLKSGSEPSVLTFTNHDEPDAATPMNFRVPAKFHREFKLYAVQHGMSMVELLQQSFQLMKSQRKR
jgi:hypothetical protein